MKSLKAFCGIAAVALVLSGCGGGGSGSSSPSASSTSGTTSAVSTSSSSSSTSSGSGSGSSGSGSTSTTPPSTSAKLTWAAPTTNTNGSALTGLAGYRIYYGTSQGSMTNVINVASAGATTYTITNLTPGTWYFAVTAYTNAGLVSALSNVGSKTIT